MENNRMKLPLFDDFWIDFQYNVKRRWFAPELYATCDTPGAYSSLIYDPERQAQKSFADPIGLENYSGKSIGATH